MDDVNQNTDTNTPLLGCRTYFGTVVIPKSNGYYKSIRTITHDSILLILKPEQLKWIERHAPDYYYWRDEFRNQWHLYVKRPLTENQLMLAQMIFMFSEPSHYPVGDEANWPR